MKKYFLLLIISTIIASCSKSGEKIYNCDCNSPYRDKYLIYDDGQDVKFSNGTDTISFRTKVFLATSYKDIVDIKAKCEPCIDKPCISYCWFSSSSIDLNLSIITLDYNEIVCAYGDASSDKFNVYRHAIQNLNINDTTLIFSKDLCLKGDHYASHWWGIMPHMFKEDTYFKKHSNEIGSNYDNQDWIDSKSAVQSMTITEGVGISRIEFECGEVWTIVQ